MCALCPAGRYSVSGSTSNTCDGECGPGRYSTAGSAACSCCPVGTFGDAASLSNAGCSGQCSAPPGSACLGDCLTSGGGSPCPAGQFSSVTGATSCTPCPPGRYAPSSGMCSGEWCTAHATRSWTAFVCQCLGDAKSKRNATRREGTLIVPVGPCALWCACRSVDVCELPKWSIRVRLGVKWVHGLLCRVHVCKWLHVTDSTPLWSGTVLS